MPADRYFADVRFVEGDRIELEENEARHLVRVARGRVGDRVELVNGRNQLAQAVIADVGRDQCQLTLVKVEKRTDRPPRVVLAVALPRLNRLDTVLEKGTELGASDFWLFPGERSEKQDPLSDTQMRRVHAVLVAAMKQSGRFQLPALELLPPLSEWQQLPNLSLFGDVRSNAPPLLNKIPSSGHIQEIAILTGPEAGFSDREVKILENLGAQGVSFHHNILRADTAPIAALSLVWGKLALL
jgi:16S rRNA (uracil1498-N3)-methyltransferase